MEYKHDTSPSTADTTRPSFATAEFISAKLSPADIFSDFAPAPRRPRPPEKSPFIEEKYFVAPLELPLSLFLGGGYLLPEHLGKDE